jgi:hypothetical protein
VYRYIAMQQQQLVLRCQFPLISGVSVSLASAVALSKVLMTTEWVNGAYPNSTTGQTKIICPINTKFGRRD